MPRQRIVNCRICKRHIDECGPLSRRFRCEECSERRVRENAERNQSRDMRADPLWQRGMMRFATQLEREPDD